VIFHGPLLPGAAQLQAAGGSPYTLTCGSAALALTAQDATLTVTRLLTADSASLTLTAQDAALTVGRYLQADSAALTLAAQDASFTYTQVPQTSGGGGGWIQYHRPEKKRKKRPTDTAGIPLTPESAGRIAREARKGLMGDEEIALVALWYFEDD